MSKRIIIPAYDPYPGPEWDVIFEHAADIAYVILNVNSGVGAAIDHVYVAMAAQLKAANIQTLGYVSSRYGARPIGEVQREIGLWFAWYQVSGIFADEMDYKPTSLPYYKRVKSATGSSILVTNPGSVPDESYRDLDAIICVAETDEQTYLAKTFPEWTKIRPHNVAHIVFGVTDIARVLERINDNNADFFYLTSTGGRDPQFSVPATLWPPDPVPVEQPQPLAAFGNDEILAELKKRLR